MPVPALVLTKFAAYPFVDNRTFAVSAGNTPTNTTLFELIVATAIPSYGLLFAVMPEVMLTPNAPMFAVNPTGCVSV
jgi:hypothetical protein